MIFSMTNPKRLNHAHRDETQYVLYTGVGNRAERTEGVTARMRTKDETKWLCPQK